MQDVQQYFNHDIQDGTDSRNDDAVSNRSITAQQRDHGTVQSSSWTFKQRSPDEKWFVVVTRNDREWGTPLNSQHEPGNDSNLLIVFYVQIMPDDFVMQLHRF